MLAYCSAVLLTVSPSVGAGEGGAMHARPCLWRGRARSSKMTSIALMVARIRVQFCIYWFARSSPAAAIFGGQLAGDGCVGR